MSQPNDPVASYYFNQGPGYTERHPNPIKVVGAIKTNDRFGNPESAYFFTGTDKSYINLGTSEQLKPRVGSLSIWFKIENLTFNGSGYESNPIVLTKSTSEDDFFEAYSINLQTFSKRIKFTSSYYERNQAGVSSSGPLETQVWYHAVLTWSDTVMSLYLDGALQARQEKNFPMRYLSGDSVMLGNTANKKNNRFFCGYIDDIALYDRVLTQAEIEALFKESDPNLTRVVLRVGALVALFAVLGALLYRLAASYFRKQMRKEQERYQLNSKLREMRILVIQGQMNPHFVFNAMNAVQDFILSGKNDEARLYLGKFSKLLRSTLEGNQLQSISLDHELELLSEYCQIESLRFDGVFQYEIISEIPLFSGGISVPRLLIQPIVENAIWHGLLQKEGSKKVTVRVYGLTDSSVCVEIKDNGIGRENAAKLSGRSKPGASLALSLIEGRLNLYNESCKDELFMEITDLKDEAGNPSGTMVRLKIPILEPEVEHA